MAVPVTLTGYPAQPAPFPERRFSEPSLLDCDASIEELDHTPSVCSQKLVFRESSHVRRGWQLIVALLLVYTATVFPYQLAFIDFRMSSDSTMSSTQETGATGVWEWLSHIVDWLFYVDLVVYFFFSYKVDRGREITDLRLICCRYLRTTFLLNLIACIPTALMEEILIVLAGLTDDEGDTGSTNLHKSSRIGRLQRISRLARMARIGRILKFAAFLDSPVWRWFQSLRGVRIVNFFGSLILAVHLFACGWFLCASVHDVQEETWVYRRSVAVDGTALISREPWEQWLHSMYFVLTVFTTVGFGDMSAMTLGEIVYVMCTMIVGAVVNSIILSEVITVITSVDQLAREVSEQKGIVKGFAIHTGLDTSAPALVRSFTEWVGTAKAVQSGFDRNRMKDMITCGLLPRRLAGELQNHLFDGRLTTNRFILACRYDEQLPPRFPLLVAVSCSVRYFECKEVVYYCFDQSWSVFLVHQGTFANIGRPGRKGGTSMLSPLLVCAATNGNKSVYDRINRTSSAFANSMNGMRRAPALEMPPKDCALTPYQLFGVHNYFGDTEIFLDHNGARRSCVRCESKVGGCALVLNRLVIFDLMAEFPRCAGAWRSAAIHREEHRKALLMKLTCRHECDVFAASTVQQYYRRRSRTREEAISSNAWIASNKAKMARAALRGITRETEAVPEYARILAEDVKQLREEVGLLNRRAEEDTVSVHQAVDTLKAELIQVLNERSLAPRGCNAGPLSSCRPAPGNISL